MIDIYPPVLPLEHPLCFAEREQLEALVQPTGAPYLAFHVLAYDLESPEELQVVLTGPTRNSEKRAIDAWNYQMFQNLLYQTQALSKVVDDLGSTVEYLLRKVDPDYEN